MVRIKLLLIVLDKGYDKKIKHILNKFGIKIKTVSNASGTATQSILNYFGLTETEKGLFMAIIPEYSSKNILSKIKSYFKLNNIGTGIALTIPISGANKFLSDSYKKNNSSGSELNVENKKVINHHLIITIVSEGYLEQVMEAAKKAGSSGGTAIKGRSLSDAKKAKILSFNIEPEKDIVLNIVSSKNKTKVMEKITQEVGIKTEGKGVCISLPIDELVGLKFDE